ncbi:MAG: 4Fe-4S dicluster domain-containing protein [Deltaproteobacteria bacterium]|nr:4Fe-4S dicluster domain-containing protein [Deltaproteobacteria bacterium]
MTSVIIAKSKLNDFLASLKSGYQVLGPVRQGDMIAFGPVNKAEDLALPYSNTRLSIKSVFFPQSERMFGYSLDKEDADAGIIKETPKEYPNRVVLGLRPCDAKAVTLVDVNMDNPQFQDPWWVKRRETTTLIGLGCEHPCSTCFCTSMGSGPFDETGLDVLLTELPDAYLAKSLTPKGDQLLKQAKGTDAASPANEKTAAEIKTKAEQTLPQLDTAKLKDKNMMELFNARFWERVQFACINCGACTFLCPTCWCFDIQDEVSKKAGDRIRNWDSCMFPLFTLHGTGHNPRDHKVQRVRQRFMHKLKYYIDKYGDGPACVGCGRCVQACPVNIDIRNVITLMNEYQTSAGTKA